MIMMSNNSFWVIVFVFMSVLLLSTVGQPLSSESFRDGQSRSDGGEYDVSADKRPSFFVGSRYGRSPQVYQSKTRRLNVAPRNDRFFLGSRYGKRSGEFMATPFEQDASSQAANVPYLMHCVYTGIKDFFRCKNVEVNDIVQQLPRQENDSN